MKMDIAQLRQAIRLFNAERNWEQFHSPKNLSMALVTEAAEVVEQFRWKTCDESRVIRPEDKAKLEEEVGDVLICLLNLADKLDIDPVAAAEAKLKKNEERYPAEKARGRADKWNAYL